VDYMKYMLQYDSCFGRFPRSVEVCPDGRGLFIDGSLVTVTNEKEVCQSVHVLVHL
jgi:glyceraldehyde-3-phosphate dehydrogenase/erythrose-4-phosphate dehydrogenase